MEMGTAYANPAKAAAQADMKAFARILSTNSKAAAEFRNRTDATRTCIAEADRIVALSDAVLQQAIRRYLGAV